MIERDPIVYSGAVMGMLRELAEKIYLEGYTLSEAYPISKWRRHRWPDVSSDQHKVIDAFIFVFRSAGHSNVCAFCTETLFMRKNMW